MKNKNEAIKTLVDELKPGEKILFMPEKLRLFQGYRIELQKQTDKRFEVTENSLKRLK